MSWLWLCGLAFAVDDELVVEGERTERPGEVSLSREEVRAFPGRSADALLRATPGLHASAHGGHGKGFQYFLRGVDMVHGSDLAVEVAGVPMNEPSQVHGHGYLDLHHVPSVLVHDVQVGKGSVDRSHGPFNTIGWAHFNLGLAETGAQASAEVHSDRGAEISLAFRPENSEIGDFIVAEAGGGQGFGDARGWTRSRVAVGKTAEVGRRDVDAAVLASTGTFESPGVLRRDDLDAGRISFWSAYPTSGGGRSARVQAHLRASLNESGHHGEWMVWAQTRDFQLDQDFTGAFHDPLGDATRQSHEALATGVHTFRRWLLGADQESWVEVGAEGNTWALRSDTRALHADAAPPSTLEALQTHGGTWTRAWLRRGDWVVNPGLRADGFVVSTEHERGGGRGIAGAVTPGVAVLFTPGDLTVRAGLSRGLRAPEARGVVQDGPAPLNLTNTAELAVKHSTPRLALELGGFAIGQRDEIVLDHLTGRFEAIGSSRRLGVEAAAAWRPLSTLQVRLDATYADARSPVTGVPVPYAPRTLVTLWVAATEVPLGTATLTAGVRPWFMGRRPLTNGFSAAPTGSADLVASVDLDRTTVTLELDNPLARKWVDGAFVYASWFDTERPRSELPVQHITAGSPPVARLGVQRRF